MGVFDDHKLEQLDWMSQMTETIESYLNTVLSRLPDRVVVTYRDIIERGSSPYLSFSVRDVVSVYIQKAGEEYKLSWEEQNLLGDCFTFEIKGGPEIDLRKRSLSGEIALIKIKQTFSDEELQPLMGKKGYEAIGRASDYGNSEAPVERLNEILDLLGGCSEHMKNRSGKKKVIAIKDRLGQIFRNNEWRIRDMALSNKVGFWIKGYIVNGNLADLTNLCKLKVMTHNNMPIYSVKEEV
jgi:hypothetical protein